jgi:hypothetical protein
MSKCQKNKYSAIRCNPLTSEKKPCESLDVSSLIAEREKQDSMFKYSPVNPILDQSKKETKQIVQKKQSPTTKQSDIDLILEEEF